MHLLLIVLILAPAIIAESRPTVFIRLEPAITEIECQMITQALIDQLKLHEGVEKHPYTDTVGKTTIGGGRNLTDRGISTATIEQMLIEDIELVQSELDKHFPDWCKLTEKRQMVLIDMCFNMGLPKLIKFTKFWKAVKDAKFPEASKQMLDSKWAKQVGQRAQTLSKMMTEG